MAVTTGKATMTPFPHSSYVGKAVYTTQRSTIFTCLSYHHMLLTGVVGFCAVYLVFLDPNKLPLY